MVSGDNLQPSSNCRHKIEGRILISHICHGTFVQMDAALIKTENFYGILL